MKKFFTIFVFLSVSFLTLSCASAQEDPVWLADKKRLENLPDDEKRCEEIWNTLWPEAKRGNLEARNILYTAMVIAPDAPQLLAPGNSEDRISRLRDIVIMAAHSEDYHYDLKSEDAFSFRSVAHSLYEENFSDSIDGELFLKCIQHRSGNCTEIVVKGKLIPSFEDYAKQIDAFMQQGMRAHCLPGRVRTNF